jgi:hypothetical protein
MTLLALPLASTPETAKRCEQSRSSCEWPAARRLYFWRERNCFSSISGARLSPFSIAQVWASTSTNWEAAAACDQRTDGQWVQCDAAVLNHRRSFWRGSAARAICAFLQAGWGGKGAPLRFIQFVIDTGARVKIPAVSAPQAHFEVAEDAVKLSLQQEEQVTTQINALVSMAKAESDYTADNFLTLCRESDVVNHLAWWNREEWAKDAFTVRSPEKAVFESDSLLRQVLQQLLHPLKQEARTDLDFVSQKLQKSSGPSSNAFRASSGRFWARSRIPRLLSVAAT